MASTGLAQSKTLALIALAEFAKDQKMAKGAHADKHSSGA
jgi:hypothetical protein